ncbi:MAG: mechanosensitive ion channel family protein [Candidatus Bathyarchaeia archaeon]|nr:mechanosensitive ion channel family protein [Candidatus Bathyarchaeota archaeon]
MVALKRSWRVTYVSIIVFVVAILWALTIQGLLPEELRQTYLVYFNIVRAITAIMLGILAIELVASLITVRLKHLGRGVYLIRNVVVVMGYVAVGLIVLAIFEVTGVSAVAGATVSGLVIGLGLQPVLANLFAGLIILGTGFLKPGANVKISGGLPLSPLAFPAYKMFSRDEYMPTLRGIVVEVGLMHTKILSESGELVKIPNNIAFTNSVVMEEQEEPKTVRVRYEFPVQYDPDIVLSKIREEFDRNNVGDYRVYLEEQSDKNYYIVLVVATAPPNTKVREFRSELLKHMIKVHRTLIQNEISAAAGI